MTPAQRSRSSGGAGERPTRGDRRKGAGTQRARPARRRTEAESPGEERVQKILAQAGLGSRRACEELIRSGQVTINGQIATLGAKADPRADSIKVAGKRIRLPERHRYLLLNKPRGFVTTTRDPEGRPTVLDLIPERMRRGLRPVGRLDFDTEGLLLLTDDGELGQLVAHPRHGCKKTYEVKVKGLPDEAALDRLRRGIPLAGRRTAPSEIRPRPGLGGVRRRRSPAKVAGEAGRGGRGAARRGADRRSAERPRAGSSQNSWWVVRLAEGRTRQIREMFLRIGHPVQKLRRIAIGPVRDPHLPVGSVRELSEEEVRRLRESAR